MSWWMVEMLWNRVLRRTLGEPVFVQAAGYLKVKKEGWGWVFEDALAVSSYWVLRTNSDKLTGMMVLLCPVLSASSPGQSYQHHESAHVRVWWAVWQWGSKTSPIVKIRWRFSWMRLWQERHLDRHRTRCQSSVNVPLNKSADIQLSIRISITCL